jgi:sulfite exporter TauE/SafE
VSLLEFYLIFSFGLLSSLHCMQMCGPIVLAMSLPFGAQQQRRVRWDLMLAHLAYNGGRVITYVVLGALAGQLGRTFGLIGELAGVGNAVQILTGALMLTAGLVLLGVIPAQSLAKVDPLGLTARWLKPLARRITSPTIASKFALGLVLGFLPCGLIYVAMLKAIQSGTALAGALTMLAFGLGTAGALLTVGIFSSAFSLKLSRWGSRLAAVGVTLLGLFLLWRGVMPMLVAHTASHCQ